MVGFDRGQTLAQRFRGHAGEQTHLYGYVLRGMADDLEAQGPTTRVVRGYEEAPTGAVIQLRLPIPSRVIAPVITPIAMRILRQDASILRLQAKAIQRFGGEDFTSTEIDVLGPHIWKLLAAASHGEAPAPFDHRVTMRV